MTEPAIPRDARILVVDDNEDILHAARLLLKRHFTVGPDPERSRPAGGPGPRGASSMCCCWT